MARIAAERHGVVRTDHLRSAGLDKRAVYRRVVAGRMHRKYNDVYAWGHEALSQFGLWLAAVDACGPAAVLSHFAAAALWSLLRWEEDWDIDVTVPADSGRRSRPGIRVHRVKLLRPRDITERRVIPVTNVARTIADLERVARPKLYRRALREAYFKGYRQGLPRGYVPTRSEFEDQMLAFCDTHGLPRPRTAVPIGGFEADFLFEDVGLYMETDAWSTHGRKVAFESDHERDLWMKAEGLEFVRVTYEQMTKSPLETAARLRAILARLRERRAC